MASEALIPTEIIENANVKMTRQEFEKKFCGFIEETVQGLGNHASPAVTSNQKDIFFKISLDFLSDNVASTTINRSKAKLLRELSAYERLLKKTVEHVVADFRGFEKKGGLTAELASSTIALMEEMPFDQRHKIRAHRSLLSKISRKPALYEYTIDLELFVNHEFSSLQQKDKDMLMAAAMVAAGVFTRAEIRAGVVSRMPMKRSNARKFYKKTYEEPGVERYYSWMPRKKKPTAAATEAREAGAKNRNRE